MHILNRYVTSSFLGIFFMAIAILTFAMTGANLVKIFDLVARGIPASVFARFILYVLPQALTFSIPWAVMAAVVMVFSRLSADCELTAMRACGVSILQIVSPIMLFTIGLTALCLYLQMEVSPPLLLKARELTDDKNALSSAPLAIIEPGRMCELPGAEGTAIKVEEKLQDQTLRGIQILRTGERRDANGRTRQLFQQIDAESGRLEADTDNMIFTLTLRDCRLFNFLEDNSGGSSGNVLSGSAVRGLYAKNLKLKFDYGKELNSRRLFDKYKYLRMRDLMGEINRYRTMVESQKGPRSRRDIENLLDMEVELNQRIAMALAPVAFLLLGMPLAIRSNRKETLLGIFISLLLAGLFSLSIVICENLTSYPWLYPQYLLWLPNIIFQVLGAWMTFRISRN